MSKRLKSTSAINTRLEFDSTINEICSCQLEIEKLVVKRDKKINEIREEHDPDIIQLEELIGSKLVLTEKFAVTHRELIFGNLKSTASSLGTFGFRTGNPALVLLNGKWKWADVLKKLKEQGRLDLIRTKEDPDKDALKKLSDSDLAAVGCRIKQDETFFIEPKRDNPERITT